MSAETLAEQVAKIREGDHVTARFRDDNGEWIMEADARTVGKALAIGTTVLRCDGRISSRLVEIIEHTPAKPAWHAAKVIKARLAGDRDVDTSDMPKFLLVQADEDVNGDWISGRSMRYHHEDLADVEVIVP